MVVTDGSWAVTDPRIGGRFLRNREESARLGAALSVLISPGYAHAGVDPHSVHPTGPLVTDSGVRFVGSGVPIKIPARPAQEGRSRHQDNPEGGRQNASVECGTCVIGMCER